MPREATTKRLVLASGLWKADREIYRKTYFEFTRHNF